MKSDSRALFAAPIELEPVDEATRALALYETACQALAEVKTIGEAKHIFAQADAIRVFARQANNRGLEIDAAEIRILAERRLGELIDKRKSEDGLNRGRAGGGRPSLGGAAAEPPKDERPTLAEIGVDKKLSSRGQRLAHLGADQFEKAISTWCSGAERDAGRVTVRLVHDEDKKARRAIREKILGRRIRDLPDQRFGVIYADPEWRFEPRSRVTGNG